MYDREVSRRNYVVPVVPKYLWPLALLVVLASFVATTNTNTWPVTAPLSVALLVSVLFYRGLWKRRRGVMPWFEIGPVYVAVVTLYAAYPLIGFLALGGTYRVTNDNRLWVLQPTAWEVGQIAWLYVWHLTSFAAVYLIVRRRLPLVQRPLRSPTLAVFVAVGSLYLLIQAFTIFVGLFFNTSANS